MKMRPSIAALAVVASCAAAQAAAQTPIKIGFLAELSGPQGAVGEDQYDGFMLVVERNGGRLGGVPIQIIKEDSQLKTDLAQQLVDKLIEKDRVQIITGITFSNIMMAIHKKVTDKGVLLLGSNAGPSSIAGAQCSPLFFSSSWQNDEQAEVVGKYAADKGYRRAYLMVPNYQAGKDFLAGFKRFYKGEVVNEVFTSLQQMDFSAELAQLAAANPDVVFVFYPGGLGIQFLKQYKQAGLLGKIPLLTVSTSDGITLPAQRETALGVISGTFWGPDFKNAANQKFVADFEKKHNRIPSQYAAQAYDSALLLDSALAKVKGNLSDKNAFTAALKGADFASVRGSFKFNNNNFPIQDMHVFQVAVDDKGRYNLKTIGTPLKDHRDAYHAQCPLK